MPGKVENKEELREWVKRKKGEEKKKEFRKARGKRGDRGVDKDERTVQSASDERKRIGGWSTLKQGEYGRSRGRLTVEARWWWEITVAGLGKMRSSRSTLEGARRHKRWARPAE
jgi:hypothetical protein